MILHFRALPGQTLLQILHPVAGVGKRLHQGLLNWRGFHGGIADVLRRCPLFAAAGWRLQLVPKLGKTLSQSLISASYPAKRSRCSPASADSASMSSRSPRSLSSCSLRAASCPASWVCTLRTSSQFGYSAAIPNLDAPTQRHQPQQRAWAQRAHQLGRTVHWPHGPRWRRPDPGPSSGPWPACRPAGRPVRSNPLRQSAKQPLPRRCSGPPETERLLPAFQALPLSAGPGLYLQDPGRPFRQERSRRLLSAGTSRSCGLKKTSRKPVPDRPGLVKSFSIQ